MTLPEAVAAYLGASINLSAAEMGRAWAARDGVGYAAACTWVARARDDLAVATDQLVTAALEHDCEA